jgi:hypothetical protein
MQDVPQKWTVYKEVEKPIYPGGWEKLYYCGGIILNDEKDKESCYCEIDNGMVPLVHLKYFNVPDEPNGLSLPRHIKPLTQAIDRLVEAGLIVAENMLPMIIKMAGKLALDSAGKLGKGVADRVYTLNAEAGATDLASCLTVVPGAEVPASVQNMIQMFQGWCDMLGGGNLRGNNNIPRDASEEFIRAFEDADHARVSEVRANLKESIETLYEIVMNLLENYDDEVKAYKVRNGYSQETAIFAPTGLQTGQRDYLIQCGGATTMPPDPMERNKYVSNLIDGVIGKGDRDVALGTLELMDVDPGIKGSVRAIVTKYFDKMEKMQQQAARNSQPTPEEAAGFRVADHCATT